MYAKTFGVSTYGLDGEKITVEVDVANGFPAFDLVGLPDAAVRESKERVRAAIKNSGFAFPKTRITVNLAPADLKKDGSALDLPIAVGILAAGGQLGNVNIQESAFIGELSLDGTIRMVPGVLPMLIGVRAAKIATAFIPAGNRPEGELVDSLHIQPVDCLRNLVLRLSGEIAGEPLQKKPFAGEQNILYSVDFSDVQGQFTAKRALEIAAAGGHNVRMVGAPGSGKTMLARRLPTILPPLTEEEALEVTKIYSIAGLLKRDNGLITERPFRSPHHTISHNALIGGGSVPKPGEVTLSHNGVLFLDEFPEFSHTALEVLRQPLEDGFVTISRVQATFSFPADFILVSAENPCPCGYYGEEGDKIHNCTCTLSEIERYRKKISGPLLDRIDLQVHVSRLAYNEMHLENQGESSAKIRERVIEARRSQSARLKGTGLYANASMGRREIKKFCALSPAAEHLLAEAYARLGLSARSYDRIIKVARTIADLEQREQIEAEHVAEAVQLRTIR